MDIFVTGVEKQIAGNKILKNINLELQGGKIYGIHGKNGSGKTMLLRCLSGLLRFDSGTVKCDGKELYRDMDVLPQLGLIIENIGFWKMYNGFENLKMLASIRKSIDDDRIAEIMTVVGLDPQDKRSVGNIPLVCARGWQLHRQYLNFHKFYCLMSQRMLWMKKGWKCFGDLCFRRRNGVL